MGIQRFSDPEDLPSDLHGGVVAIGNFDGVHRGHQQVLANALNVGQNKKSPALVLTFEPHPRTFFVPEKPVFRLTDASTKAGLLGHLGFDATVELTFDKGFSSTLAEDFVANTLANLLKASHVVTGFDFHFGKARQGNPEFLKDSGLRYGFETTVVEEFGDEAGETVSSSRIRTCLAEGDISEANGLLGYSYRVTGSVVTGKQLGRELGYPTINLELPPETGLHLGIYAVRVRTEDGKFHDGVASFGRRPTFDDGPVLLETFIFDFDRDVYGQVVTVYFHGWLRGEEKFESADALVDQMNRDSAEARALLSGLGPEHGLWPDSIV